MRREGQDRSFVTQCPKAKPPMNTAIPNEDGIEEVCWRRQRCAYEVEQRPFDAQVGEGLVQASEELDLKAMLLLWFVGA